MDTIRKARELLGLATIGEPRTPAAAARKAYGVVRNKDGLARVSGQARNVLVEIIREGFPVAAVQHIIDRGRLTPVEVDQVVLPRKTLANRRKLGALTAEQSDRLFRVARVIAAAEDMFGNAEKADAWLRRPTTALDGEPPLDRLDTEEGAREVETLLTRIGHGLGA